MITLTLKTTFASQFAVNMSVNVTQEILEILGNAGFLWNIQRTPSTNAEKKMAGYDKRPKGFKRNTLTFSEDRKDILFREYSKPIEIGRDENDQPIFITADTIEISQHIPSVQEYKFAEERKAYARNAQKLDKLAARVEYDGEVGDGTAENAPTAFLQAIKAWMEAQLAKLEMNGDDDE